MTDAPKSFIEQVIENCERMFETSKADFSKMGEGLIGENLKHFKLFEDSLPHVQEETMKFFKNLAVLGDHVTPEKFNASLKNQFEVESADKISEAIQKASEAKTLEKIEVNGSTVLRVHPEHIQNQYDVFLKDETIPQELRDKLATAAKAHIDGLKVSNEQLAKGINGAEAAKKTWGERIRAKGSQIGESFQHEHILDDAGKFTGKKDLSLVKKAIKGGGVFLGGVGMIDGGRRALTKDEEGNRHWVVGGVEFAGGAGVGYLALTKQFAAKAAQAAAHAHV